MPKTKKTSRSRKATSNNLLLSKSGGLNRMGMIVAALALSVVGVSAIASQASSQKLSLSTPARGAVVHGYQPLIATYTGHRRVDRVKFFVNGSVVNDAGLAHCYPGPAPQLVPGTYILCWNTTETADGSAALVVSTIFHKGDHITSSVVPVTVKNAVVTSFSITQPTNKSTVRGFVALFTSTTPATTYSQVSFYANDKLIADAGLRACFPGAVPDLVPGTDLSCWNTNLVPNGMYQLKATRLLTDVMATTPIVTVIVANDTPARLTITEPVTGSTGLNGYVPIAVKIAYPGTLTNISVTANGQTITGVGIPACYPGPVPQLVPGVTITCWNTNVLPKGTYTLVAHGLSSGIIASSAPVTVTHDPAGPVQ